ncbi:MAG: molybdopterin converting factor subunit 1 [Sedimenticola sp.]|uniref:Molybdopterin synthase sulfur carrier subunit n=1 Tax=Sedimenticola thiotaurini TaxID=1543721 RepID=A0A558DEV6_9GAMM|nr:molybdopterin converting factor subunit 1 [Sedimenticola sp.]TVT59565.1 MAG: molybdopterin converting factor subunit 1 [Sedimenticola thiotaurini]MCW8920490.1 molybdopterin converting factor subunit 1 [Sedimenticola sp.]MCW8945827.1 molybdopterin converting factor subunit 1 [Sedimenticola sp.]MCW8975196.1 molybdopterin converting factor subunit 1 [Sedimenticola sp.]
MINLRFFARLREELQTGSETMEYSSETQTVEAVVAQLKSRGGSWSDLFGDGQTVLVAVNQEMCDRDSSISDGDEVAFFPPVTGG